MASFKMQGLMLLLVALCASASKPEIVGTQKLSYSVVTSQMIVPGNEFLVHLNLFNVVNSTLYKGKTFEKPIENVEGNKFPSKDHSINLNITVEGLVSYYHNLKIKVDKVPKNVSEIIKFIVPETPAIRDAPLNRRSDFLNPIRNRTVVISATNNFNFNHTVCLPVVERKVHSVLITDKMHYLKGETLKLAALCHYSDMKPYKGPVNITLWNPRGIEVTKFRFDRSPNGIIVRDLKIDNTFPTGLCNISLDIKGEIVNKTIFVSHEVKKNFDVKVVVPSHIAVHVNDESKSNDLKCALEAFYPSGMPVRGLVQIKLLVRNTSLPLRWINLDSRPLKEGLCYMSMPLSELKKKLNVKTLLHTVLDIQLRVIESREEWHLSEQHRGSSTPSGTTGSSSTFHSSTTFQSSTTHPSSSTTNPSSSTTNPSSSTTNPSSSTTNPSSSTTNPSSSTTNPSSSTTNPSSSTPHSSTFNPSSTTPRSSTFNPSSTTFDPTHSTTLHQIIENLDIIDSCRYVVVNTTVIFTDEPLTLEFPDFTPSTFRREQPYIGYINLKSLDEVSHSYQYMALSQEQKLKLQKGQQLNHLKELLKVFPQCPLTIDYVQKREVEIKIRHFAALPKQLPVRSTDKPIHEETIKTLVQPSFVSSFEFKGHPKASRVEIEATYKDINTGKLVKIVKNDIIAFQTTSKQPKTIQLRLNQQRPNVTLGQELRTKISTNFPCKNFFYEIYNDQILVLAGNRSFEKVEKSHNLNIRFNQSESRLLPPVARLLVWTATPENEIVTDSLLFLVQKEKTNKTRLEVSEKLLTKNRTLVSTIHARPNSDVLILSAYEPLLMTPKETGPMSFGGMLKKLCGERLNMLAQKLKFSLLHKEHSKTPLMNSLSLPSLYTDDCLTPFPHVPGSSCLYSSLLAPSNLLLNNYTSLPSLHHDSWRVLNDSRAMVFTDGILHKSPLEPTKLSKNAEYLRQEKRRTLLKDRPLNEQLESYVRNIARLPMQDNTITDLHYFRIVRVPESGRVNFTIELPAIRRLYSLQALTIHSEHGVEVLETPVQVTVRPPVLADLKNPRSVVEGEEFALKVKLHNPEDKAIKVEVMIKEQEDFTVECTNEPTTPLSQNPRTRVHLKKQPIKTQTIKIEPGKSVEHRFYIKTVENPQRFKLTTLRVPVIVMHERFPYRLNTTFCILPKGKTNQTMNGRLVELTPAEKIFNVSMDITHPQVPRENLRKTVKIYRDIMAPVLDNMCVNIFNLTAQDEVESMSYKVALHAVKHVLNCIKNDTEIESNKWHSILSRLNKSIDISTSPEQQKISLKRLLCLKKIVERYQSFFLGKFQYIQRTPESIEMALQALEGMVEWRHVADYNMTHPLRTINWILKSQKPSGHFEEIANVPALYNELAPNTESVNVPMTAKVIIVLTKAKELLPLNRTVIERINKCIVKACQYIESKIEVPAVRRSAFTINIACHALILCNSPKLFVCIGLRDALKINREHHAFWLHNTKNINASHASLSIMATAYAALSHLRSGDLKTATPICNWLLTHMKSNGRFVNSEDTGVALEALTLFSKLMNKKNRVSLSHPVIVIPHKNRNLTLTFNTTQTVIDLTKHVMREFREIPKRMTVILKGRGLCVLEEIVDLKVTKPKDIKKSESVILSVKTSRKSDLFDSVNVCVKLTKPFPNELVLIKVPVLSGHVFNWARNMETFKKLGIKWQPHVNETILLTTRNVNHKEDTCFELLLEISQRVAKIQPRIITACTFAELGSPSMVSYSETHHKHAVESICSNCQCKTTSQHWNLWKL